MAALPTSVVLKSVYNKKFLSLTKSDDAELPVGFVKFDGEAVVSQRAKLEVERAKNRENEGLVHIRCSYNNKYWVRNLQGGGDEWIVAAAQKPEEDRSKPSCTLFEPIVDHAGRVQFRHVQLGRFACLWRTGAPQGSGMLLASELPDKDSCDVYTFVDWKSLQQFPKYVAFIGDNGNGKYLSAYHDVDALYLKFLEDEKDEKAVFEVFTSAEDYVRIKSVYYNKFWRRSSDDWILVEESDESSEDPDVLFLPQKEEGSDNVVSLLNKGNEKYCERLTSHDKTDCLNANEKIISSLSQLQVEELGISRSIYNLIYRVSDGRIYDESLITLSTEVVSNDSSTEDRTYTISLPYKDIKTSTWKANVSLKLAGVKTTLQVSAVPRIVDGKIELSEPESTVEYQWGITNTVEQDLEATNYEVVVPPLTTVTVDLVATQASCDVPFSYTEKEVLSVGDPIIKEMDDGEYTATNYYNFTYIKKEQNL